MPMTDKDAVKLGFWVALGFFAFSLILGFIQLLISRARKDA